MAFQHRLDRHHDDTILSLVVLLKHTFLIFFGLLSGTLFFHHLAAGVQSQQDAEQPEDQDTPRGGIEEDANDPLQEVQGMQLTWQHFGPGARRKQGS